MKANLSNKELTELESAMKRVEHELMLQDAKTASQRYEQFEEDIRLILFELWSLLQNIREERDEIKRIC